MIWRAFQNECDNARPYYYDFLDGQCKTQIPGTVQAHVSQCRYCREEIRCLNQIMSSDVSLDSHELSHVSRLNELLETHFKYAERPVTCALVKGFLPGMASQDLKITVPTPITVHVEECSTCRKDLLRLQSMNLSDDQLQRLTDCLEKGPDTNVQRGDHLNDDQVSLFACVDYASFSDSCLEHVCQCISCRERILAFRETVACQPMPDTCGCHDVSSKDLFNLALPLGFNPLTDECSKVHETTVQHVCHCETCLRHLGLLDQMLISFLNPDDSGVVTNFRLNLEETRARTDDGYAGYPIQVDVQKAIRPSDSKTSLKTKATAARVGSNLGWMKMVAVVVVLLGVTIFSMLPKAGAGFLDHVYKSTTNASVVHIKVLSGDGSTLLKEHWVFPPDRAVTIQGETRIVCDAKAGLIITTDVTGNEDPEVLVGDRKKTLERQVRGLFNVWPPGMSQSATLTSEDQGGLDVYDLRWSHGKRTFSWTGHVDHATQRVRKVDRSEGDPPIGLTYDVRYPTAEQGEAFLRQNQIEFNESF